MTDTSTTDTSTTDREQKPMETVLTTVLERLRNERAADGLWYGTFDHWYREHFSHLVWASGTVYNYLKRVPGSDGKPGKFRLERKQSPNPLSTGQTQTSWWVDPDEAPVTKEQVAAAKAAMNAGARIRPSRRRSDRSANGQAGSGGVRHRLDEDQLIPGKQVVVTEPARDLKADLDAARERSERLVEERDALLVERDALRSGVSRWSDALSAERGKTRELSSQLEQAQAALPEPDEDQAEVVRRLQEDVQVRDLVINRLLDDPDIAGLVAAVLRIRGVPPGA